MRAELKITRIRNPNRTNYKSSHPIHLKKIEPALPDLALPRFVISSMEKKSNQSLWRKKGNTILSYLVQA